MPVNEVKPDEKQDGQSNEPLLNINLPAPADGNPRSPLSVGQHNAAAQHNFKKVADLIMAVINNQRMVGSVIAEQQKQIKALQESNKKLAENLGKFLKENENEQQPTNNT